MIELVHTATIHTILDRWRLTLPVPVQLDESLVTKEHLRQLIQMLIDFLESDYQPPASNDQPSPVLRHGSSVCFSTSVADI